MTFRIGTRVRYRAVGGLARDVGVVEFHDAAHDQVRVLWDGNDPGPTWELIRDLEPEMNHPINPSAHMLTDLWLDSLADVPEVAPQYFANLNAARLAAALGHLASVALLLIVRSIVTPLRKGWKAGTR